jgi:hypothetical protein
MTASELAQFAQYGAIGVIAALALIAVRYLFKRETEAFDRERARADRLETELAKLNDVVRTLYVTTLSDATRAIGDALASVRKQPRGK